MNKIMSPDKVSLEGLAISAVLCEVVVVHTRQLVLGSQDELEQILFPMASQVLTPTNSEQNLEHCGP